MFRVSSHEDGLGIGCELDFCSTSCMHGMAKEQNEATLPLLFRPYILYLLHTYLRRIILLKSLFVLRFGTHPHYGRMRPKEKWNTFGKLILHIFIVYSYARENENRGHPHMLYTACMHA